MAAPTRHKSPHLRIYAPYPNTCRIRLKICSFQPVSVVSITDSFPKPSVSGTLSCTRSTKQFPGSGSRKVMVTLEKCPSAQFRNRQFCTILTPGTYSSVSPWMFPSNIVNGPGAGLTSAGEREKCITRPPSNNASQMSCGRQKNRSVILMVWALRDSGAVLSVRDALPPSEPRLTSSFSLFFVLPPSFAPLPPGPSAGFPLSDTGASPSPPGPPAASSSSNLATPLKSRGSPTLRISSLTLSSCAPSPAASTLASGSSPTFSSAMYGK
mmetsp:Transcript_20023/g.49786  ORF Transcript_20023/g.49786 Transcript_20023/m.49786 type:complete len:268 (+) Transcript_20023:265-1068(+)